GIFTRAITTGITEAVDTFTRERETALRDVELRFRRLFESGVIGAVEWRMSGDITAANTAFLEMLRYTKRDVEEGRLNFVTMAAPWQRQAIQAAVRGLRETGQLRPVVVQYQRSDGSDIDVEITGVTLDDERSRGFALVIDV